jgi:hypothetical protein
MTQVKDKCYIKLSAPCAKCMKLKDCVSTSAYNISENNKFEKILVMGPFISQTPGKPSSLDAY